MKKKIFLLLCLLGMAGMSAKADTPQWVSDTDAEKCEQILQFLDQTLGSPATDIDISTVAGSRKADYRKVVQNGKILIFRNNKKYTLTGMEIQ